MVRRPRRKHRESRGLGAEVKKFSLRSSYPDKEGTEADLESGEYLKEEHSRKRK